MVGRGSERGNVALRVRYEGSCVQLPSYRWFLYYFTYIDDARSNANQVFKMMFVCGGNKTVKLSLCVCASS